MLLDKWRSNGGMNLRKDDADRLMCVCVRSSRSSMLSHHASSKATEALFKLRFFFLSHTLSHSLVEQKEEREEKKKVS